MTVPDSTVGSQPPVDVTASADVTTSAPASVPGDTARTPFSPPPLHRELNERLVIDLIDAVRSTLRKEQSDRLRDVYLIGDIEKDTARVAIERMRELANDNDRPLTLYINSAGGN